MHLPQSVLPNDGGGGAEDAVDSGVGAGAGAVSAAAADADAAAVDVSAAAAVSAALLVEAVSLDGLSAGLLPPPQASQTSGTETMREREANWRGWARLMVAT